MEVKFSTVNAQKVTKEFLAEVENDIIKRVVSRFADDPSVSWLEVGGYVRWAKESALIDRGQSFLGDIKITG